MHTRWAFNYAQVKHNQPDKTPRAEEPAAIYGLADPKGERPLGIGETVESIRHGLPMVEFEGLDKLLGIGAEPLAKHLGISRSTLVRRRKSGRLDMQESDRLLRYARLFARASSVLGGEAEARDWLQAPARALDYETPLHFAETEAGAREVENVLGRIEYGVFS
ncbi:type II RES/Xre toxin-antitoxin system antitoxin [Coraliomargarita parva]|uniref:type II RES/Xre toxin-antitoxin system antitoxin n=1 Tax=Coraliomargarita parva TaxID=3014050 RepID=UPI0022B519F9|nr:antitoxin Xre/MbcA/ParS toxin-binding domain-containing protein [Coraliomargarita parva]